MKAHLTQKGSTLQKTNVHNVATQLLSLNESQLGKQPNLRKTLEILQNHFNAYRCNLTSKQAGLLFTEGNLQQTDDSIPTMTPLRLGGTKVDSKAKQSFALSRMAYQSTTDCGDNTYEHLITKYQTSKSCDLQRQGLKIKKQLQAQGNS